jgi:ferric iron reductase protein FhuF
LRTQNKGKIYTKNSGYKIDNLRVAVMFALKFPNLIALPLLILKKDKKKFLNINKRIFHPKLIH